MWSAWRLFGMNRKQWHRKMPLCICHLCICHLCITVLKHILGPEIITKANMHLSHVILWALFFQGYSRQKYYQNLPERATLCLIPWIPHHQWWPSGKSKGLHRGHSIVSATRDKMGNVLRNISLILVLWCTQTYIDLYLALRFCRFAVIIFL